MVKQRSFHFKLTDELIVLCIENQCLVNPLGYFFKICFVGKFLSSSQESYQFKNLSPIILYDTFREGLDIIREDKIIQPSSNEFLRLLHRLFWYWRISESCLSTLHWVFRGVGFSWSNRGCIISLFSWNRAPGITHVIYLIILGFIIHKHYR